MKRELKTYVEKKSIQDPKHAAIFGTYRITRLVYMKYMPKEI